MLAKKYVSLDQIESIPKNQPVCITLSSKEQVQKADLVLANFSSLRGIQLNSCQFLVSVNLSHANFISIIITNKEHLNLIPYHLYSKKKFIELIIPYGLYDEHILSGLTGINRLIIDFSLESKEQITKKQIQDLFAELILHKFYPFTKGLSQDYVAVQHMIEFYQNQITSNQINKGQSHVKSIKEYLKNKEEGDLL